MPAISNVARLQQYTALLEIGLSRVFKDTIPTHDKLYNVWLREKKAQEWTEDELVTTGFGTMPLKTIGGDFVVDKPKISSEKDYTLVPYGLAFVGEYELLAWDKYSVFVDMTAKLRRSGTDRKNILTYAILNNGLTTTDPVYQTYNGETLFNTAHTLLRTGGGTGKNRPTSAVALSYLGMQSAITDYYLLVNEDGLYINLEPKCVICHPSLRWVLDTLCQSDYRPDNANMSKNTLKDHGFTKHSSPYLSSTTAWFMLSDKSDLQMAFHVGHDLTFRRDYQQSTWNSIFSMYGSFRVALLHWYGTWGTAGV